MLKGKTAIVTGASRGIGREIAIALSKMGADIGVVYTSNDAEADKVKKSVEENGVKCTLIKVDLSCSDCAEIIYKSVQDADILIHNASVQIRNNWENVTVEEYEKQANCNFRSVLLINQKYVGGMKENKWGRIITIGSVQERKPNKQMLVYSSMKCALTAMSEALAMDLAPFGITVNAVAPGIILTDRNTDALKDEEYRQTCLDKIPLGRFGNTTDMVGIIKLLCSDEGSYITGQNIFVDGGMSV